MSMDLRELYQEIIIDHNRNPRNHYSMEHASCQANGFNPLCGDKLTVYLTIDNGVVSEVSFVGTGCAISQASASLMTESIKGKTIEEVHKLFHWVHELLTNEGNEAELNIVKQGLVKLQVLSGVKAFPARVKCATLAWHTLEAALNKDSSVVKTE